MSTLPQHRGVTRREFLNYVWLASMALLLAKTGSITFAFALPRRPFTSSTLNVGDFPAVDAEPLLLDVIVAPMAPAGMLWNGEHIAPANYRIFVSNTQAGVFAFMNRCTHMGCVFPWSDAAGMFACPCHGSQFTRDGAYIAGPAPRSLDRFPIVATDAQGNVIAHSREDGLLALPANAARITISHSALILGLRHP